MHLKIQILNLGCEIRYIVKHKKYLWHKWKCVTFGNIPRLFTHSELQKLNLL